MNLHEIHIFLLLSPFINLSFADSLQDMPIAAENEAYADGDSASQDTLGVEINIPKETKSFFSPEERFREFCRQFIETHPQAVIASIVASTTIVISSAYLIYKWILRPTAGVAGAAIQRVATQQIPVVIGEENIRIPVPGHAGML